MTYNVFSGMLNPTHSLCSASHAQHFAQVLLSSYIGNGGGGGGWHCTAFVELVAQHVAGKNYKK